MSSLPAHTSSACANGPQQSVEVSWLRPKPRPRLLTAARTRVDKVSAELVTLTYGTIVAQLCKDYEFDYVEVNRQLDRMGYNIGMRLIEDFLAKSNAPACSNFREVAEMISKVRAVWWLCIWKGMGVLMQ